MGSDTVEVIPAVASMPGSMEKQSPRQLSVRLLLGMNKPMMSRFVRCAIFVRAGGHELIGLVLIEPSAQHQALLPLFAEMSAQHDFCSVLAEETLQGRLFYSRVRKACAMRLCMP